MAQPQLYTKVDIYINGTKILQDTEIRITRESGLRPLTALGANDFVGAKQGAKSLSAEFSSQVPFNSFEYNPGPDEANANFVQLTVVAASSTLTSLGIIMGDDLSDAVEGESKLSVRFHGQFADWVSL